MEQNDVLLARAEDLAAKAVKTGCAASRFLTPAQAQIVAARFKDRSDVELTLDGGYENAERVRAVFRNPSWGGYERAELFCALGIAVPQQETLGHRDILGALMALGIERDTIGDIIESPLTLICLPELSGYIVENLTKAGRTRVKLSQADLSELAPRENVLTEKTDTVASLRLDAVLGAAFGLSRSKAVELIAAGRVSLDYRPCIQPAKELREGALISVRGLGRTQLLECGGVSKKGRIFVRIGIFQGK